MELTPSDRASAARPALKAALAWWAVISVAVILQLVGTFLLSGTTGLWRVAQEGPISNFRLTFLAVGISWLLAGFAVAVALKHPLTRSEVFRLAGFLCLALLYVNVMRERTRYGDVGAYIQAANSLRSGKPFPARYLYPPFWATVLSPLAGIDSQTFIALLWLLNLLSLFLFFLLLQRVLERYGFSPPLATIVVFLFSVVNVPILRTLGYVQVNLHVANLILLTLLFYPRRRFASAFALGVAVHLKSSPLALALAFLVARDHRWLTGFMLSLIGLGLVPVAAYGWSPYADFVRNIANIYSANAMEYRENSLDSFFTAAATVTGVGVAPFVVPVMKALLVAACVVVGVAHMRRNTFVPGPGAEAAVYNMLPSLLILMVMASPLVWTHHPVMMSLAFLVLPKCLSLPREWVLFGAAYYLEFLVPTFDLFPWSYGRLIAPLVWLGLAWSVRGRAESAFFTETNRQIAGLFGERAS